MSSTCGFIRKQDRAVREDWETNLWTLYRASIYVYIALREKGYDWIYGIRCCAAPKPIGFYISSVYFFFLFSFFFLYFIIPENIIIFNVNVTFIEIKCEFDFHLFTLLKDWMPLRISVRKMSQGLKCDAIELPDSKVSKSQTTVTLLRKRKK